MGLDALLQNQFGHLPKFHIYSLSRGSKLSLLLLYGQWFPRFSKLPYLRMKLGHWPKCQKLHIYPLSTPWGQNSAYFCSTGSGFWDINPFSKLPYLGMKLGKWPKFQKLHIYPLSTPGGRNWPYFCSTGSSFRDTDWFSKLPYLGMKLDHWPKCQKLHVYLLNYPPSPKFHSVLLYGCPCQR